MRQTKLRWVPASMAAPERALSGTLPVSAEGLDSGAADEEMRPVSDPRLAPRDEAVFLLHTAAEVEHALLVQYLYAAFSLGGPAVPADKVAQVNGWKRVFRQIAMEEMAHLASVQNLLRLLGGPLNFEREDYPFLSNFYPFHFRLERLTKTSLAKYIFAEMPEEIEGEEIEEIKRRANQSNSENPLNRVGALYKQIGAMLSSIKAEDISPEGVDFEALPEDWSLGFPTLIVRKMTSVTEAASAIREIAQQGEGPEQILPESLAGSHFGRFLEIYRQFPEEGTWTATRNVPNNPTTELEPLKDEQLERGRITNRRSRRWAQLFNLRYRMLLADLAHALHLSGPTASGSARTPHGVVVDWTFAEMRNLALLAGILTALPQRETADDAVAAPAFELPYSLSLSDIEPDRWRLHRDLLSACALLIAEIKQDATDPNVGALQILEDQDKSASDLIREFLQGSGPVVKDIKELLILPPLAVARFGSSPDPMDNYEVVVTDAIGFRQLVPAPTLVMNPETGAIQNETTSGAVKFRDDQKRVRPVAPFLEVWARFSDDGDFEPLTLKHLTDLGLAPSQVEWKVTAGNFKASRRTGKTEDRVQADTGVFGDHQEHDLRGTAENFKAGKSIKFGTVRYIRPTDAFPEIRLRFTPSGGRVYGPTPNDPLTVDDVYDGQKGGWDDHFDGDPQAPFYTFPAGTYQGKQHPQTQRYISDGYFDDSCDGIVEVRLTFNNRTLNAFGRICSGVPDFAPDSFHVRTLGDDIEQVLLGPNVAGPIEREQVTDIIRRAMETVRLMNTSAMNADQAIGGVDTNATNQAYHEFTEFERALEPVFGQGNAPYYRILQLHERLVQSWQQGFLPMSPTLIRSYDEAGDLSNEGRRKMPALMRGSDTLQLTLTRRQIETIRRAATDNPTPVDTPELEMIKLIQFFQTMAALHGHIPADQGGFLSQLFGDPAAVLQYLRTEEAKGPLSGAEQGKPLVVPGDPDASAFVRMLRSPDHPMHGPYSAVVPGTTRTGLQIVERWIASL